MHHINITFPDDLKVQLDVQVKQEGTRRSTLIQKAVRVYLHLKKQKSLTQLLQEGYIEMTDTMSSVAKEFGPLDDESLKYLD